METATFDPKTLPFDLLDGAQAIEPNKKRIIVDYLSSNGIPKAKEPLNIFQPNGTIDHDSFEHYLGMSSHYSTGSFVKLALGTPLDFHYDVHDGAKSRIDELRDTSHFNIGSFVHQAILEPEKWAKAVCEPPFSRASHDGCNGLMKFWEDVTSDIAVDADLKPAPDAKLDAKKEYIESLKKASGCLSVSNKDYLIVTKMHERWMNYAGGVWHRIMASAIKEVSVYSDDFMGLPMRVRPDGLLFADQIGVNAIVSVKTTNASNVNQYQRQAMYLGYDMKEAAYQAIVSHITGIKFDTTINIVLSTSEPFACGVFIYSDHAIKNGMMRFSAAVSVARECIEQQQFPGWDANADDGCYGIIDFEIN